MFRDDLKKIIGTELELCGIDYQIQEFTCGEDLVRAGENLDCEILVLDIEMKELDGICTAKKLRSLNWTAEIIFVTSHPDFVFQGYEVRALNYILKPYESEKIVSVLHTALAFLPKTKYGNLTAILKSHNFGYLRSSRKNREGLGHSGIEWCVIT